MPSFIERLRLWFGIAALVLILTVTGAYIYVQHRFNKATQAAKELRNKLDIKVGRNMEGFTFSKAEGGRTLFTIHAARAVQFKQGGRATLHDVNIVVYGKNSDRYDQIYGSDFEYDPEAGIARADGEVQIDLEGQSGQGGNPAELPPQEIKNPIHLKTSGLVFHSKTGVAETDQLIDFRIPQGNGSAVGAVYDSKANQLTLKSKVHVNKVGTREATLEAKNAVFTQNPNLATLEDARVTQEGREFSAALVTVDLRDDNTISRARASGGIEAKGISKTDHFEMRAANAAFDLNPKSELKNGTISGQVTMHVTGSQAVDASAEKLLLDFGPKNILRSLHAREQVHVVQQPADPRQQAVTLSGDALDMQFQEKGKGGIQSAQTVGPAEIVLTGTSAPGQNPGADPNSRVATRTVVTAGQFTAGFDRLGRMESLHGTPNAKLVFTSLSKAAGVPGAPVLNMPASGVATAEPVATSSGMPTRTGSVAQGVGTAEPVQSPPDRTSTSRELTVHFDNAKTAAGTASSIGSVREIEQTGDVVITEPGRTITGERARYIPATDVLTLERNVRLVDTENSATSTSDTARLDRRNKQIAASGNVKTTFISTKQQSGGALLASSEPIHVTAPQMTADTGSSVARYSGGARLWQGSSIISAPNIDFDRAKRSLNANSGSAATSAARKGVTCTFVQVDSSGKQTPVEVTAARLSYVDSERIARFDGGFILRTSDGQLRGDSATVYLRPRTGPGLNPPPASAGSPTPIDHIDAQGHIQVEQPGRKATGSKLVFTANDGKFVLTGTPSAPPVISDETKGSVSGEQLVFFSRDDRVLVQGSRTVTHTQVQQK